jgi:hypothetical protein
LFTSSFSASGSFVIGGPMLNSSPTEKVESRSSQSWNSSSGGSAVESPIKDDAVPHVAAVDVAIAKANAA